MKNVLLLTNESATINAVSSALETNGKLASNDICRDVNSLISRLNKSPSPAALVDIDSDPQSTLSALSTISHKYGDTRFVVLAHEMQSEFLLAAMRAGVRHFLLKESITTDLNKILKELWPVSGSSVFGSAVTVLSAGGGCGSTTLAVNLATELQMLGGEAGGNPALIVDLDPFYGAVSSYLGLEGQYGIYDLLARSGHIDAELIQSTSLEQNNSLRALISAPRDRLGEPPILDADRLGDTIDACKSAYPWTVIDAPRIPMQAATELARRSSMTLLLLQLTVKDIRAARRMLNALHENGISTSSIRVIGTRYRKRRGLIEPSEAAQALGLAREEDLLLFSNDFYAVTEAVNLGKPLAQTAPRSDFRRDVQKLAASIHAMTGAPK